MSKAADWILDLLTDNVGLKIFSLLISLGLFSLVHGSEDAQRVIDVDLVALLPPTTGARALVTDLPPRVKVTLRGRQTAMAALTPDSLRFEADLRRLPTNYTIDPRAIDLPMGISVIEIKPRSLLLEWADVVERRVPVVLRTSGDLPRDQELVQSEVSPREVLARGPRGVVDAVRGARTEAFSIGELSVGQHRRTLQLEAAPPRVSWVDASEVSATVITQVVREEVTLRRVPVLLEGGVRANTRPSAVDVVLRGTRDRLQAIVAEEISATLEAGGPGSRRVGIQGLPAGVEPVLVTPPHVTVR